MIESAIPAIAPVPLPMLVNGRVFIAEPMGGGYDARPLDAKSERDWKHIEDFFRWRCKGADTMADLIQAGETLRQYITGAPPGIRAACVDIYKSREAQLKPK